MCSSGLLLGALAVVTEDEGSLGVVTEGEGILGVVTEDTGVPEGPDFLGVMVMVVPLFPGPPEALRMVKSGVDEVLTVGSI